MKRGEYVLSVVLAVLLVVGAAAWTHATDDGDHTVGACRDGRAAAAVLLKGMTLYPRCPGGKRG